LHKPTIFYFIDTSN